MTVIFQSGYTLPSGDQPLTHARIAHSLNWLSGGTAVPSTTDADYFANAPLNTLTYERWKPAVATGTWEYAHTAPAECDYCCIAAHTLVGCTLRIQYYDGSAFQNLIPTTTILDNSEIMAIFAPTTATRWRININTAPAAPEVGVVKFGKALQMQRPLYGGHAPMLLARNTVMRMNESETGEFLGQSKWRTYLETEFAWQNLTAAWVRSNWPTFQRATETEPFFLAWRPVAYSEVAFGRRLGPANPSNQGVRDLMSVEFPMRGYSYD